MAQGQTNLNVPPPNDQPVADPKSGRLTEKWRAWFAALAEVATWTVTGVLTAASAAITGAITAASITVGVAGILGSNPLLHVREQQASGTNGGDFNSGAWQTRTLNTSVTNQIPGAGVAANRITLTTGTYFCAASAPANRVDNHKLKLRDVTNGADVLIGQSESCPSSVGFGGGVATVNGLFTVTGPTDFELQHQCGTTRLVSGLGIASAFGVVEVYAEALIWKLA